MKKALITGITGQDGSYLAELLLSKGYEVHGMIRRSSSFNTGRINHIYRDPHEKDVRMFLHYGDLNDASSINMLLRNIQPDEIYNLGAQSHVRVSFDIPEYTGEVDGLGAVRILEGRPIDVFNHGRMQRDFTYIDDIVEGVVRTLGHIPRPDPAWDAACPDPAASNAPFRLYNIGNNQPVELGHFIEVLEECLGKKADKNMLPIQAGEVPVTSADVDDLMRDVGFRPATPIQEGLRRFVEWYRGFYRA